MVADALEPRPALNVPIAHALPVNDILAPALPLQIGPIDIVVVYEVDAPLPTNDELLRLRPDQICMMRHGWRREGDNCLAFKLGGQVWVSSSI